jgi:uncharacterized membrane protein YbaN (DUF454 family)
VIRLLSALLGLIGAIMLTLPLPTGVPCLVTAMALYASTSPSLLSSLQKWRTKSPHVNVTLARDQRLAPRSLGKSLRSNRPIATEKLPDFGPQ